MDEPAFISDSRGFTLVEIIIVISLILVSFSVLSIRNHKQEQILAQTANELVSAIRYTRQLQQAGDWDARFQIASDAEGYVYRVLENKTGVATTVVEGRVDPEVKLLKRESLYENAESDDIRNHSMFAHLEIRFTQDAGTGTSILVSGRDDRTAYKITVIPTSGRIHLYQLSTDGSV